MWFRSLFDSWLARSSRTPVSRIRRVPRVGPLLEILEDRTLLSTYTVNALTDTGAGSGLTGDLRYCVTNATSGSDTIVFGSGLTGTIKLESALPALNASVAIQGPGASQITVERDPASYTSFGIFTVGSAATVEISGLTLSDAYQGAITNAGTLTVSASTLFGNYNVSNGGGAITNSGTATVSGSTLSTNNGGIAGAIDNTGTMTINNSTLSGNSNSDYYSGGAISNNGTLTITNSTLSGNEVTGISAGATVEGGAIYMGGGKLALNNSTLSGNSVYGGPSTYGCTSFSGFCGGTSAGSGLGGGLYIAAGTVTIDHSTIAGNAAVAGGIPFGPGEGGGIFNAAAASALEMHDTILADNAGDYGPDLYGGVTSLGYNLFGNSDNGSGFASTDLVNINPQLGPLQNNGGPTQTMALLAGSPAINAGDNTNAPAYDQRGPGFPRIFGGRIDIGAFEVQDLSGLTVNGFPTTITAGATTGNSFTVSARNADGSIDTSYTGAITLSSTDPTAAFADAATGTPLSGNSYTFQPGDNGTHTFTAVLTKAGYQSITATDTTNASFTGSEGGIRVQPAAANTMIVAGFPTPIDATAPGTFSVTLKDRYGNIASGYTGTVQFSTSDPQATIDNPVTGKTVALQGFAYTFTAGDAGVHTFYATFATAGTQSITATDTTTPSLTGTDGGITVNPAPASQFVLTAPSSATAGVPFSVTVTAEDSLGHTVTDYTGTVSFSSNSYQAVLPADYTFTAADGGVHTFNVTLKQAGVTSITATDTTTGITGSATVTDNPAAASKMVVGGFTSPATAGVAGTFSVLLDDAYGNVATGYTGTVHFSSSDARALLPSDYTFTAANGGLHIFSATLKTAGTQSITATDTTTPTLTATQGGITVNPAAASQFVISAPSSVTAGVSFSVTVTVEDAYDNVAVSYAGTVHFSSTDPRAKLPKNYTFTASDKGVHTFTGLVLHTKGNQTITVTDPKNSALTGSVIVDVLSGTKTRDTKDNGKVVSQDESESWRDWELAVLSDLDAEDGPHRR